MHTEDVSNTYHTPQKTAHLPGWQNKLELCVLTMLSTLSYDISPYLTMLAYQSGKAACPHFYLGLTKQGFQVKPPHALKAFHTV